MSSPDHQGAVAFALQRLEQLLSPSLTYHNVWHTQGDVMVACARLARMMGVSAEEEQLLRVAAAFHDIGYAEHIEQHELVGARVAAQVLPDFGFGSRAVERVMGMIMATRVPQVATNLLEQLLADADLDVLGRDDFFERNERLRQEWANLGNTLSERAWLTQQIAFLQQHAYFTPAARELRGARKAQHLAQLCAMLAELDDDPAV